MASLKRGRLDCLLLDRIEYLTAFDGAIWDRLIELLEDGTLLSLGVSVRKPAEADAALDNRDVCHLELPFNVLDWRWRESGVVDRIRARPGVTVHARNVLLHGLLADADPATWPIDEEVDPTNILQGLQTLTRKFCRASVADLCVAYVRGQDWIGGTVHIPDSGRRDIELSLSLQRPLDPGECAAVMQRMPRVPERLLLEEPLPERPCGALDQMRNS
ncbi:MAG: hypothetical protein JO056_09725 [Alphaproteobacteria bacterium]|nr:hypothetical protein [Alphaproteobacteria bacterium]